MPKIPTDPAARSQFFRDIALKSAAARRANRDARVCEQRTERLAAHIAKSLEKAPPLSDEQRRRLAELLRPAVKSA